MEPVACLRDTGAQVTLVNPDLVRGKASAKHDYIKVSSAFGEPQVVSMTEREISSSRFGTDRSIKVKAGVVEGLNVGVLLGHDVFLENPDIIDPIFALGKVRHVNQHDEHKEARPMGLTETVRYLNR